MKTAPKTTAKPKKVLKNSSPSNRIGLPEKNSKGQKLTKAGRAVGLLKDEIFFAPDYFD